MNHTTLGIVVAVVLAGALVTGIFAMDIQSAHAWKKKRGGGGGDSVNFDQSTKQESKCLALIIEPVNCNNIAINAFANLP
ncbi:MAG TPA: hypothetical protein VE619_10320 [Nitrososphaeraceae archaeon]|nr:hypothetical protein [Nitrososphaeraceae archaeon]